MSEGRKTHGPVTRKRESPAHVLAGQRHQGVGGPARGGLAVTFCATARSHDTRSSPGSHALPGRAAKEFETLRVGYAWQSHFAPDLVARHGSQTPGSRVLPGCAVKELKPGARGGLTITRMTITMVAWKCKCRVQKNSVATGKAGPAHAGCRGIRWRGSPPARVPAGSTPPWREERSLSTPVWYYWNAVSVKLLSLRECSRSGGMAASFSMARMPMSRCCATCRL